MDEPIAYVTGTHNGRFVVAPLNPAMVLPVGMALYTAPPKRPWVGLTDEEKEYCIRATHINCEWDIVMAVEAKLRSKNNG